MAKIDFNTTLKALDGTVLRSDDVDLTLSRVAINALLVDLPDAAGRPEQTTGQQKFDRGRLAEQIHADGAVDLKAEQVSDLKARIARGYNALVVLRAWELLDPPASEAAA